MIVVGIAIVLALLYVFNPSETQLAPKCLWKSLTGWSCPGCGMQRFLHAFMHGRFAEAFAYNYLLVLLLPYVAMLSVERLVLKGQAQQKWRKIIEGRTLTTALCVIAPGWFIIRNILNI